MNFIVTFREDLTGALYEAKKRCKVLELNFANLKAESNRYESDIAKQQRRIEKLLEASSLHSQVPLTAEARREIEKSQLVRQLKTQILNLRSSEAEKEIEIDSLKKSQKGTKLVELSNEKEEYYLETLRLKQILRELRDALQNEKQKRVIEKKRGGTGDEIRQEVARLTSGYQNILKGIHPGQLDNNAICKPKSNSNSKHITKKAQSSNKIKQQNPHNNSHGSQQNNSNTYLHTATSNGPGKNSGKNEKDGAKNVRNSVIILKSHVDSFNIPYPCRKLMYLQALLNFKEDSNALDELDYFNGVADGNDEIMMMTSTEGKNQRNCDKNNINTGRNDDSESHLLGITEPLQGQDLRIFVSKIELTNLPNIEGILNDRKEMTIAIRSARFIPSNLSGPLTLLSLSLSLSRSLHLLFSHFISIEFHFHLSSVSFSVCPPIPLAICSSICITRGKTNLFRHFILLPIFLCKLDQ